MLNGNRLVTAAIAMALCGAMIAFTSAAQALIIVSDNFTGTDGATINGRTPNTSPNIDLPGGSWFSSAVGVGTNPSSADVPKISGNTAQLNVNNTAYIPIQSAGSYTKPAIFTISGDLKVGTITGDVEGVGLGFSNVNSTFDLTQEIALSTSGKLTTGNLHTLIATYNAANFGGHAFDPTTFYHLLYTVNTSALTVSDITLSNGFGSQSYTLTTSAFTDAKTAYAGIFSNATSGGTGPNGNIDNFLITTPEPASLSLLAGGALLLLRRRRR